MSVRTMISNAFNKLSTALYAETHFPEPPVRQAMEKDGWAFDVHISMFPMMVTPPLEFVRTPDGRPAVGVAATDADHKFFQDTVTQTRRQLNLSL